MSETASLRLADQHRTLCLAGRLADAGHAAVDAAYRFAIAQAGPAAAAYSGVQDAETVLVDALEAIAHLCDKLQLPVAEMFERGLNGHAATLSHGPAATPFDLAGHAAITCWQDIPAPASSTAAHADTVLALLQQRPAGVTSSELRNLGVKNPSNVVMTLIRAGSPIERIPLTRGGRKGREALYRLDRANA